MLRKFLLSVSMKFINNYLYNIIFNDDVIILMESHQQRNLNKI